MQASVITSYSWRFGSDVWVNTERKALFAVASVRISAAQFCKACVRCSNSGMLSVVVSKYKSNTGLIVRFTYDERSLWKN